jgi:hypothetical protein
MPELCIPELHQPRTASTTIARNATKSKSTRLQVFQEPHLGGVHGSILFQAAKFVSGLRCIAWQRPSR